MGIIFASYGNSQRFYKEGFKSSLEAPHYLKSIGLNGYEYLCNQGVHISLDGCAELKKNAENNGISLSVRGYDFLCMSDTDEIKREKNLKIICDTLRTAHLVGAKKIVLPLDNCAIKSRAWVKKSSVEMMNKALMISKSEGIDDVDIGVETMGLIHDYGDFSEVVRLCKENERFVPCINIGNIYARNLGKNITTKEYEDMFDFMKKHLGEYRAKNFHLYFSKVEYTNQGFRENMDFCDKGFENQSYKNLLDAVVSKNVTPFVVAKSPHNTDTDGLEMKKYYMEKSGKNVY